jgi:hypothetical protein
MDPFIGHKPSIILNIYIETKQIFIELITISILFSIAFEHNTTYEKRIWKNLQFLKTDVLVNNNIMNIFKYIKSIISFLRKYTHNCFSFFLFI